MKKCIVIITLFFLFITLTGCSTIYKAAVDERNVKTIASDTKIKSIILIGVRASNAKARMSLILRNLLIFSDMPSFSIT